MGEPVGTSAYRASVPRLLGPGPEAIADASPRRCPGARISMLESGTGAIARMVASAASTPVSRKPICHQGGCRRRRTQDTITSPSVTRANGSWVEMDCHSPTNSLAFSRRPGQLPTRARWMSSSAVAATPPRPAGDGVRPGSMPGVGRWPGRHADPWSPRPGASGPAHRGARSASSIAPASEWTFGHCSWIGRMFWDLVICRLRL